MVRNDERRSALADAGIRVLADEGARGLTHRAVDAAAGTPRGTASNYFPSRDELIAALTAVGVEKIVHAALRGRPAPSLATAGPVVPAPRRSHGRDARAR